MRFRVFILLLFAFIGNIAAAPVNSVDICAALFGQTSMHELSPKEWAREFTRQYQKSLNHEGEWKTATPAALFEPENPLLYKAEDGRTQMISGESDYPLSLVVENLKLKNILPTLSRETKIISVGEGMSLLVPTLVSQGFSAKGIDIWYDKEFGHADPKANYISKNKENLVAADARQLPYATESIDLVLSHEFLQNLSEEDADKALREMVRVCTRSGQVRVSYTDNRSFDHFAKLVNNLKAAPWLNVQVSTHRFRLQTPKGVVGVPATLLVIQKTELTPTSNSSLKLNYGISLKQRIKDAIDWLLNSDSQGPRDSNPGRPRITF